MHKIFKREEYLKRIRGFYNDFGMIKVITGIRRCGKSFLLKSIVEELKENGVKEKDIIYIELDRKPYKSITTPEQLEMIIDTKIVDDGEKYIFIDEIENVRNFETLINAYREEGRFSIFVTGSNSYLLSGDLVTKLTGRYLEFELLPLTFKEYIDMKQFLGKEISDNYFLEFENYVREGGFPGMLYYDSTSDKIQYVKNVVKQIYEKDIKKYSKIRNKATFEVVQKYVINNFGSVISIKNIVDYFKSEEKINIERNTVKRYIEILEKAKIIYPCELFDMKSKRVLKGEKKYYLADFSLYYANNTDNRINYGPVLENVVYNYLCSKNYELSVGKIGKFECDFIVRKDFDKYFYIQVCQSLADKTVEEREYRPFYMIKEMYPRYIFTMDMLPLIRDGVNGVNIVNFIVDDRNL